MASTADLLIAIRAVDQFSAIFKSAEQSMAGLGNTAKSTAGAMATTIGRGALAGGTAIAAGLGIGIKAAGDLEQSVANISTIKPSIDTAAVFASLNEMQTRIPALASDLGDGLYDIFSSMDVGQEEGLRLLETFSKGAVGASTDAKTFGTAVMGVMNAYKLDVSEASAVSDAFFDIVNKGVVTGPELAASLGPVTQAAKAAGIGWRDLGPMIAAVTKEGGPAAQNINNLNNFLQKITTKEAQKELNALGVATKDATGDFRPTLDVLADLKAKADNMTEAGKALALQEIFPDAQARQGAQTLMSQLDFVTQATKDAQTASGSAEAAYTKMSATFNSQVKLMQGALMSVLTTIGGEVLPHITPLVTAFSQWLPGAFKAAQDAIAPFLPTIQNIGTIIADAWRTVGQVFGEGWSPDASINPVVDAIGRIALVIRDQVIPAIGEVAGVVSESFGAVLAWFETNMPLIQQTVQLALDAMAVFWAEHGEAIKTTATNDWTIIKTIVGTGLANLGDAIRTAMQVLNGDWDGAWATATGALERNTASWQTIAGASLSNVATTINVWTGDMLTTVQTWMTETGAAIDQGMQATLTAISSGWQAALDLVSSILPTIRTAILAVWNLLPEDIRADLVLIAEHIVTQGGVWLTNITTAGTNMLTAISTALGEMVTAVTTWATTTFLAPIQTLVGTATTEATNVGNGILTSITGKLTETVNAVTTWAETTVLAPLRGLIGTASSIASSIGQGIIDAIVTAINNGVAAVRSAAYSAARAALDSAMNAVGVPARGGGEGIEGRALGGPVTAGMPYIVGERGPEMFVPAGSGRIDPRVPAGGAAPVNVYVTVQGSLVAEADLTRTIARHVGRALDGGLTF